MMAQDIAMLIERNLQGVFGEGRRTPFVGRRRPRSTPMTSYLPNRHGVYRGRDEIVRAAGVIRAMHPSFRYQVIAPVEVLRDEALRQEVGRAKWLSGAPDEPAAGEHGRGAQLPGPGGPVMRQPGIEDLGYGSSLAVRARL